MDRDRRINVRFIVSYVITVAIFVLLAARTEINVRDIAANEDRIEQLIYSQCRLRNASAAQSNAVIDRAIMEERAEPRPDRDRIRQLREFKGHIVDCGDKPSP